MLSAHPMDSRSTGRKNTDNLTGKRKYLLYRHVLSVPLHQYGGSHSPTSAFRPSVLDEGWFESQSLFLKELVSHGAEESRKGRRSSHVQRQWPHQEHKEERQQPHEALVASTSSPQSGPRTQPHIMCSWVRFYILVITFPPATNPNIFSAPR